MLVAPIAIGAAIKGGMGLVQGLVGLFKKKPKKPVFSASDAARQAVAAAELARGARRPGAENAAQEINQGVSNVAREAGKATGDTNKLLAAVNAANTSANNARNKESALDAQFNQQSQRNLTNALQTLGRQQMAAKVMQNRDYMMEQGRKDALISSGITNAVSGVDDVLANNINQETLDGKFPVLDKIGTGGGVDGSALTRLIKNIRFPR